MSTIDTARQRLRDLIVTHSPAVCAEPRRFEALLKDYCPHLKREINLLTLALKERIPADLIGCDPKVYSVMRPRLVARLTDDLGITHGLACWAVDSWAFALLDALDEHLGEDELEGSSVTSAIGHALTPNSISSTPKTSSVGPSKSARDRELEEEQEAARQWLRKHGYL